MVESTQKQVRLSSKELDYLKNASFLPTALVRILSTARVQGKDAFLLSVSREVAEEFRSAFMHRVAVAGLGPDYEPNSEGRMLEELIDRFYFGEGGG
jgi:hypothetical protein